MRYGSVCSGIEAASVAWEPLGWKPQWFSEIEAFPSAVLAHHWPEVPNLGDMTNFKEWNDDPIDLLVGGTPCQSFSVAGLRKGLADPRGNLMLTFGAIAAKYRPRWLVWENVPGVLSSNGGRDFGTFLGMLGELGYGFAYRVLDAQYFGVAQRRRRVFVVACLGDWRAAAAVLFERESLSGNPAPSREKGQEAAGTLGARAKSGGGFSTDFECAGGLQPVVPKSGCWRDGGQENAVLAFQERGRKEGRTVETNGDLAYALTSPSGGGRAQERNILQGMAVRRLTPVECERLQGFPDGHTDVPYRNKPAADGPRYKAIGNSMAVPVMRWIGNRIDLLRKENGR